MGIWGSRKSIIRFQLHNSEVKIWQYSNFRNYAPPLDEKGGIITEKVFPVFSESFFLDLFWLGHVHLGVNGCHRKVGTSNVKK